MVSHGLIFTFVFFFWLLASPAVPLADPALAVPPVAQGVIQKFLTNPEGDIDGLLLDDGSLVRFSPTLSTAVADKLREGDAVKVEGQKLPDGEKRASALVVVKDKSRIVENEVGPHSGGKHANLKSMKVQGRVARIFLGPERNVKQVLLTDGTQVRVPREAAGIFRGEFREGSEFAAEGVGTENRFGKSIEATAIGSSLQNLTPLFGKAPPAE